DVLRAAMDERLGADDAGRVVLSEPGDQCRSLVLSDLEARRAEGRLRLTARGEGRVGLRLLGFCLFPTSWKGYVDATGRPAVGDAGRLGLGNAVSALPDANGHRTRVGSRIWDVVKGRFQGRIEAFVLDLGPPIDEVRGLLDAFTDKSRAATATAFLA